MTSTGLAILLAVALLAPAFVVHPGPASACECPETSAIELAFQADVVFEGRAIRQVGHDGAWVFRVDRLWKGALTGRVHVRPHANTCGVPLNKRNYVVYGMRTVAGSAKGRPLFATGWCEGTRRSSQADQHFAALGPGLPVAYLRVALSVFAPQN
jgi:hypothetical protein